jgi:hypothetical protein
MFLSSATPMSNAFAREAAPSAPDVRVWGRRGMRGVVYLGMWAALTWLPFHDLPTYLPTYLIAPRPAA